MLLRRTRRALLILNAIALPVLALLLACGATSSRAATATADPPRAIAPAEVAGARLFYQGNIPIAVLTGSPAEIGRQHAALLTEPATHILAFPKKLITDAGAGAYYPLLIAMGQLLVKNAPPDHLAELNAFTDASKLSLADVAVGNTLLELRRMGCSVLMVEPEHSATGGPLFGRNFDFPTLGELDRYSLVFIVRPTGKHAFASVTFPAAVGVVSGMNDTGLAVATLDVEAAGDGSPKFEASGTPLAFVFRRILEECTTVDEAEKVLRGIRATTWMNLAVCDKNSSAVFEITPKTIGRRDPKGGICPCTNHFRTPGLTVGESCYRFSALSKAAGAPPLSIDDVRSYLHAANQGDLTLQTMVFEPRKLTLHLALGTPPTSDDPLTAIDLAPLFKK